MAQEQKRKAKQQWTPSEDASALLGDFAVRVAKLPQRDRGWVLAAISRQFFPGWTPKGVSAQRGGRRQKAPAKPKPRSEVNTALEASEEGKALRRIQQEIAEFRETNPVGNLPPDLYEERQNVLSEYRAKRAEQREQFREVPPQEGGKSRQEQTKKPEKGGFRRLRQRPTRE